MKDLIEIARRSPSRKLPFVLARHVAKRLPSAILGLIRWLGGRPNVGSIDFGDFRRLSPISNKWGVDRGTPIDRYYIEGLLAENADHIQGRALEAANNLYTHRFGGVRVKQSDVLCVETDNPRATIVGDLSVTATLPVTTFDCVVLTQTLQFIFDVRAAVETAYRALKPGGVLLLTLPGITKMPNQDRWPRYWAFSSAALGRLLEDQFGSNAVSVEVYGKVFAASAFLYGVATEECDRHELDAQDSNYPVIVAGRAIKRKDT